MKKLLLFVLISTSLTMGCTKQSSTLDSLSGASKQMTGAKVATSYVPIDFSLLDIGALHNKHVIWLLDSIQGLPKMDDIVENGRLFFGGIDFTPVELTNGQVFQYTLSISKELASVGYDFRNLLHPNVSVNVKLYINNLLTGIDNSNTFSEMLDVINSVDTDAQQNLTDADLDIIKGTCIIARYSAALWSPIAEGGLGYYDKAMQRFPAMRRTGGPGRFVIGDASASAQYFTGLGIAAIVGWGVPGANAAILGGWAVAAGLGSLCTLVGADTVPVPGEPENIRYDPLQKSLIFEVTPFKLEF
ncbi:hypothetical protein [Chitinophaga sp. sic0106]|uniref:hypothetical protein n=1 Tax=Chitinophaga sp. sic0106 TaxID=2854785 RepID=UPI001C48B88A|nr:hypothetical protein [Chitinophaga sp. sic0106]MBV7530536.1 hypothetical protein [Chitinophaga sp. sic0106]